MARLFGTDGVRGVANQELTPELAMQLGRAFALTLAGATSERASVLLGRDPRWSSDMLQSALVAGITSAGVDAIDVGVVPTPAVAFLAADGTAHAGAMISASHNPVGDNGIKFFGGDGFKLTDEAEDQIQALVENGDDRRPTGTSVGRVMEHHSAAVKYVEHVVRASGADLHGLEIVVDGANGAASVIAPQVYRRLGAVVHEIHCRPDGGNINDGCGSTFPGVIAKATVAEGAAIGISHDGDADRLIAAAADGTIIDGDVILAILARDAKDQEQLAEDTVVTTVMTNLGFHHAMKDLGIHVEQTPVGDRYVLEMMREKGLTLGGEQSGHLIQLGKATTGDGLLSAASLMGVMAREDAELADLAEIMTVLPQTLINTVVRDKAALDGCAQVWDAVQAAEAELGDAGRVLVRTSGTEPKVRVMVEAPTQDDADLHATTISAVVASELG